MKEFARGYNLSRSFVGNRLPQHIQNQIIKNYCDINNLEFILSRSEYAINDKSVSQLWAALQEGTPHIVFYSIWQLPMEETERHKVLNYAIKKRIILHFACENLRIYDTESLIDIELTVKLRSSIDEKDGEYHLDHKTELHNLV